MRSLHFTLITNLFELVFQKLIMAMFQVYSGIPDSHHRKIATAIT